MSDEEDQSDKEHDPSARKLEQAREKGELVRSPDLTTAAGYGGMVLAAMALGAGSLQHLGDVCAILLDQSDHLSSLIFRSSAAPVGGVLSGVGLAIAPFFALPALAALTAILAQRALVFAPQKIEMRLSKISPLAGFANKFGRAGLFEFGKSSVKLVVYAATLGGFLASRASQMISTLYLTPAMTTTVLVQMAVEFLVLILFLSTVIGGIDYLWQRAEHLRKNRMSRKEMLDEHKDSEGDPHAKAQRRQRGIDIATNRMLSDVAGADVVIVNPTHYAVALKWNRNARRAPVCVAKGVDEIAARIRERAALAGIPIQSDPPTARALHAGVEIGSEIRPEHYRAVAAAIRFAEAMRKRAKGARR